MAFCTYCIFKRKCIRKDGRVFIDCWTSFEGIFINKCIAGLHVTSWRPRWMTRTKVFLSSAKLTLFHIDLSRKILLYYRPTWPPCHRAVNQEFHKDTKCPHCNKCLHSNKRPCSIILILERGRPMFIFLLLLINKR